MNSSCLIRSGSPTDPLSCPPVVATPQMTGAGQETHSRATDIVDPNTRNSTCRLMTLAAANPYPYR